MVGTGDGKGDAGTGDALYAQMGLERGLCAVTDTTHFRCELGLKGGECVGHLHREGNQRAWVRTPGRPEGPHCLAA